MCKSNFILATFFLCICLYTYPQTLKSDDLDDMVNFGCFLMCKTEVTQREYASLMEETYFYHKNDDFPADMISWYDAILYCNKRSIAEGYTPCYSYSSRTPDREYVVLYNVSCDFTANGYRLPTVLEWKTAANDFYIRNKTTLYLTTEIKPHDIKRVQTNTDDMHDLFGNVWEWCWDLSTEPWTNRAACGGGFDSDPSFFNPEGIISNDPFYRYKNFGFRVVRTIE